MYKRNFTTARHQNYWDARKDASFNQIIDENLYQHVDSMSFQSQEEKEVRGQ